MVLGIVGALLFIANETNALEFAIGKEEESDVVVDFVHFMLFMIGVLCIFSIFLSFPPIHYNFIIYLTAKRYYTSWSSINLCSPLVV